MEYFFLHPGQTCFSFPLLSSLAEGLGFGSAGGFGLTSSTGGLGFGS